MTLKPGADFGGYATKNNIKCSDGRTILRDAFVDDDKKTVPLVWRHLRKEPANVLGHAVLENREDGVYIQGYFNDTEQGRIAKQLVQHKDISALSIFANRLIEKSKAVMHGVIREVSLAVAGANPGATIDQIAITHEDGSIETVDDEAVIHSGLSLELPANDDITHEDDETVGEVFETLSEKQKTAVYAVMASLMGDENAAHEDVSDYDDITHEDSDDSKEGDPIMKENVFDSQNSGAEATRPRLTPDQFKTLLHTAEQRGSFKSAFLEHAEDFFGADHDDALMHAGTYGIDNISYLFPDAKALTKEPVMITRDMEWVNKVFGGATHSPFARIKSVYADLTPDEARAKGYVTGAEKTEQVIALLRRITTPTTVYKKQKLDRDDIVDITDMDIVAWLKREMYMMLKEEIARAILVSDGRLASSADYINVANIRPIYLDDDLYADKVLVDHDATLVEIEDAIVTARVEYQGSGSPSLFCTPTFLTMLLLRKDTTGRRIYKTEQELAAALRVREIVEVPVMAGLTRENDDEDELSLLAIVVNMRDYTIGADKGGKTAFFDDFDIDFNQYKYLIESRLSGALRLPKGALIIEQAPEPEV